MGITGFEYDDMIRKVIADQKDEWALYHFLSVKAPDWVIPRHYNVCTNPAKKMPPLTNVSFGIRLDAFGSQNRLAEIDNRSDFTEIYQRELGKAGLTSEPLTHTVFKRELAEKVTRLIGKHKSNVVAKGKDTNAKWLTVASSFLEYLSAETAPAPALVANKKPEKYDNFLAEVAKIESHVLNSGKHYFSRTVFQTELYTPVKTLWDSFGNEGNREIKDEFKKQVDIHLDYARETADKHVNDYNREVEIQPDKQAQLLIENRDWYVEWLADTYKPVNSWYYDFWDKEQKTLNVNGLEQEMFLFCHYQNKPFKVALKLMQSLYSYYFALGQFNALILSNTDNTPATSAPPASDERKNCFNPPMPLDEVRRWFMQLTETNSKNGSPFLMVEQVEQFIDRAFCGNDTIQELTFNLGDGRTSVTKLFYLFYNRCTNDYAIEPTKHCKEKYVRLLTDNFTNYNYDTVFGTFNNSKNAPKEWKTTVL